MNHHKEIRMQYQRSLVPLPAIMRHGARPPKTQTTRNYSLDKRLKNMNPEIQLKQTDQTDLWNSPKLQKISTPLKSTTYANNLFTKNAMFIELLTKKVSPNVLKRSKTKKINLKRTKSFYFVPIFAVKKPNRDPEMHSALRYCQEIITARKRINEAPGTTQL